MRLFTQLGWFFKREWRHYLGAITLLIVTAILQLMPPKLVGIIVDSVLFDQNNRQQLMLWLGTMILTAIIIYVLCYIWRILLFGTAYKLAVELRSRLYKLLSQQLPGFYIRHRTGDLMARATHDVDCVVFAAGEGVLMLVDSLVIGISVLLMISIQISWQLALIANLPMPFMAAIIKRDGQLLYQRFKLAQSAFSSLNNQAQENLTSIRMIKAFGLEQHQLTRFANIALEANYKNMHVTSIDARFEPIIYLAAGLSNLLAISGGSWLVIHGNITIGQLTTFIMYLSAMIWPMLALAWMFNIVERGSAAYSRILQTLEEKPEVIDGNVFLSAKQGPLRVDINKFYYPDTTDLVLQGIHLTLTPGQMLGVCGPTGAGKSTLLALILRHFDLDEGEIRFHNLPLNTLSLDYWRSLLAVVNQTPFLFSDSIARNIALGRPDATTQQIEEVARLVCVHEDILRLPNGYQTAVGERGVMLSGGQKQRLAIARALLLEAEILILDDALSAVDGCTEHIILNNLRHFKVNRTVIITTNRLSNLQSASDILVLKQGRIGQRGNHQALLKQPGWYRDMYLYQQLEATFEQE